MAWTFKINLKPILADTESFDVHDTPSPEKMKALIAELETIPLNLRPVGLVQRLRTDKPLSVKDFNIWFNDLCKYADKHGIFLGLF